MMDLEARDSGRKKNMKVIAYPVHPFVYILSLQLLMLEFKRDYLKLHCSFNFHRQSESHSSPT